MNRQIFILSVWFFILCHSRKHFRFISVKCGSSNKTGTDLMCYLKSYTRKNPVLNGEIALKRIVPEGMVSSADVLKKFYFCILFKT